MLHPYVRLLFVAALGLSGCADPPQKTPAASPADLSIAPGDFTLEPGDTLRLETTGGPSSAPLEFDVDDASIATVSPDGTVEALAVGMTSITVRRGDSVSDPVVVLVAELADGFVGYNGADLVSVTPSGDGNIDPLSAAFTYVLELEGARVASAGEVLGPTTGQGVACRVSDVTEAGGTTTYTCEKPTLLEVFERVVIEEAPLATGTAEALDGITWTESGDGGGTFRVDADTYDSFSRTGRTKWDCTEAGERVSAGPTVDLTTEFQVRPVALTFDVEVDGENTDHVYVNTQLDTVTRIKATTSLDVRAELKCDLHLGRLGKPVLPGLFSAVVYVDFPVGLGFKVAATARAASMVMDSGEITAVLTTRSGIVYDHTTDDSDLVFEWDTTRGDDPRRPSLQINGWSDGVVYEASGSTYAFVTARAISPLEEAWDYLRSADTQIDGHQLLRLEAGAELTASMAGVETQAADRAYRSNWKMDLYASLRSPIAEGLLSGGDAADKTEGIASFFPSGINISAALKETNTLAASPVATEIRHSLPEDEAIVSGEPIEVEARFDSSEPFIFVDQIAFYRDDGDALVYLGGATPGAPFVWTPSDTDAESGSAILRAYAETDVLSVADWDLSWEVSDDAKVEIGAAPEKEVAFPDGSADEADFSNTACSSSRTKPYCAGDSLEGTWTWDNEPTLVSVELTIERNTLTCDTQDMGFFVNDVQVGVVQIGQGDSLFLETYAVSAADLNWQADGEFTLRYETLRTVNSECGSAALATVDSFVILTAR